MKPVPCPNCGGMHHQMHCSNLKATETKPIERIVVTTEPDKNGGKPYVSWRDNGTPDGGYVHLSAYEQVVKERNVALAQAGDLRVDYAEAIKERDGARAEAKGNLYNVAVLYKAITEERAKSAKLLKALKLECCCTGERKEYEPYDYITCDACDAVAEYESSKPIESPTESITQKEIDEVTAWADEHFSLDRPAPTIKAEE